MDGYWSSSPYSWFRLLVNGDVVTDFSGYGAYTRQLSASNLSQLDTSVGIISSQTKLYYDLSAYAGQSNVYITFEAACKYGNPFSGYPDYVWIDDIDIYEVNPCSYFTLSYSSDSSSCFGSSDGNATVSASNDTLYNDSYSFLWSNGFQTPTISNVVSGAYSCVVTGNTYQCVDTINVSVPQLIQLQ